MTWLHVVLLITAIGLFIIAVWQGVLFGKDIAKKLKERKAKKLAEKDNNPSDDGRKE